MKKSQNRKSKPKNLGILIPVIAVLAAIAILLAWMIGSSLSGQTPDVPPGDTSPTAAATDPDAGRQTLETTPPVQTAPPETTQPDDRLPYLLENDKLEIESIFQYTGLNPDCYWEEGRNVGAVVFTNRSEEYLESLDMTITMSDGVQLHYSIQHIPAGKTAWAYETGNTQYHEGSIISDVQYTAVFRQDTGLTGDQVTVSVNAMEIAITNRSGSELSGLEVFCHNVVDGIYFGGTAYAYPIETLIDGGTATVLALDCVLGEAGVTIVDFAK